MEPLLSALRALINAVLGGEGEGGNGGVEDVILVVAGQTEGPQ